MTNPHSHPILLDPIPDQSNRLAYLLGRVFHPAVICIPTLALVLRDLNLEEAVFWLLLVAGMVIVPGLIAIALLKQRGRFVYQRRTRGPVYIVIWFSIAASFIAILLLDGPEVLQVCVVALLVWLPVQSLINAFYTKVSTHVAVAAGCATGLMLLGKLDTPLLQVTALMIVALTMWARVTTRNHTVKQVVLGLVVGAGSVLVVFPLFLH
ncbi:MAG: hypothetical protein CL607_01180 [Anaerolineaceae bacterium]|nr:hypothetical protein [Anaerolineaceae bacterium]